MKRVVGSPHAAQSRESCKCWADSAPTPPRLPPKALQRLRIARDLLWQKLHRRKPPQVGVLALYTTPMPPPPNFSAMR
jgi:hypothetical protein